MPILGTFACFLLVGLVAASAARLYLRDARDYRAGRGDERYAWLRRSHPDHSALPHAPTKPLLRVLPQRWGVRHAVIVAVQVAAIGGGLALLFEISHSGAEPVSLLAYPIAFFILFFAVAFMTFLLTWAWDLSVKTLARRGAGAREHQQPVREVERVLAPRRRLGEGA